MFRVKHCREVALKLLYQIDVLEIKNPNIPTLLDYNKPFFPTLERRERKYVINLLEKLLQKKEMIDQLISRNLTGWTLERLLPLDRSLLRIGVAESFFKTHKNLIIDDMIRISKKFGGNDAFKLINAVLDKALA